MSIKKIVVIGPESTGKSTLCEQLANHYNTGWAKEYAREYLLKNGSTYTFDQLLDIAKGQLLLEDECLQKAQGTRDKEQENGSQLSTVNYQPIFIDTDMYVMKIWNEFVFNACHRWILNQIANRKYDLYLLCNVDLPWIKDELREYPDLASREKLYHFYKDAMVNQSTPWINISGNADKRLQTAISAINKIL
jgi:NadR type nicotinamide-nucleotide adenylyltransferase